MKPVIAGLPKTGKVRVSVTATGEAATVGGTIVAGTKAPLLPEPVREALALAFGLAWVVPVARPSAADIMAAEFATAMAIGAEPRGGEKTVTADVARMRGESNARSLATRLVEAAQKGDFSGFRSQVASALLSLSQPTNRVGGTFLEFDPAPFLAAACPPAVVDAPKRGKRAAAVKVAA